MISSRIWDPVYYFLNEIKINMKYLNNKNSLPDNILHMVDYFVDFDPNQTEKSPKIFSVFEDFHCNLREIYEFRRINRIGFLEIHLLKILNDVVRGVNNLHVIGTII